MTPHSALNGNERHCPDCGGEGRIECAGINRVGSTSQMEQPDEWTETCERCDATGVIVDERREFERESGSPLVDAFRVVRAELALAHATIAHQDQQIDALLSENRRLREAVAKAARFIGCGVVTG